VHSVWRCFTKNRILNRFVTSDAHVSQVVWSVNQVYKMCDLCAHTGQVLWPRCHLLTNNQLSSHSTLSNQSTSFAAPRYSILLPDCVVVWKNLLTDKLSLHPSHTCWLIQIRNNERTRRKCQKVTTIGATVSHNYQTGYAGHITITIEASLWHIALIFRFSQDNMFSDHSGPPVSLRGEWKP
jgi:hypothetical protein